VWWWPLAAVVGVVGGSFLAGGEDYGARWMILVLSSMDSCELDDRSC